MKKLLSVALAVFACTANAQAFKCTGPDGRVAFQEKPCGAGDRASALDIKPPKPLTEDEQRILSAMAAGKVTRGMTRQQVRSAWGRPTKINETVGSYGVHEQWVYDRGDFRAQYVYLENGIVTSIQSPSE